jgi:hypothetical protein
VDHKFFLIRGIIELPIVDAEADFAFGIWATQSREDFHLYQDFPDSTTIGPFPGQLDGSLTCYAPYNTLGLKLMAHFDRYGERPRFILEDADHPLVKDQREGITIDRALWIQHYYMNFSNKAGPAQTHQASSKPSR